MSEVTEFSSPKGNNTHLLGSSYITTGKPLQTARSAVSPDRPLLDRVPPEQQAPDAAEPATGLMPSLPPLPSAP